MKAAPLLRRWIERLRKLDISFHFNHQFVDFNNKDQQVEVSFSSPKGNTNKQFDAVILALGGGSWKNTGSTGEWVNILEQHSIKVTPLTSANCGWEVEWNEKFLAKTEGRPLKNIIVSADEKSIGGELVITKYGLEGGPIYKLGAAIKNLSSPQINIDFKPSHTVEQLIAKMESARESSPGNLIKETKQRWKLNSAAHALLQSRFISNPEVTVRKLAQTIKYFTIDFIRPRPIDEVISSAGGIAWSELDENLMLKNHPGIYCVGEMIDWEAPTGGYLLQACFATGTWVGQAVSSSD